ncbi:hypothetical protein AB0O95_02505 [Rhodoglobus sp. NPDC076762]
MISLSAALALIIATVFVIPLIIRLSAETRHRRRFADEGVNAQHEQVAADVARHAQRRAVVSVAFAIALFVAIASVGIGAPQLLGLPFGIAPGLAVSGGLLLFAASAPLRIAQPARNSAELNRRHPWSFGPRWVFVLPLAIAAAFVALLVATGLTASADEMGLSRAITAADATTSSTAGPYPGWFYGVPLIAVTVVLAVSTLLALSRVSATPSLPNEGLAELDRQWRSVSTLVITKLSTSALLLYFGGTAFIAGQATRNVATTYTALGDAFSSTFRQPEFAIAVSLQLLGGLLAISGLVFLAAAVSSALTLRMKVQFPADTAPAAGRA